MLLIEVILWAQNLHEQNQDNRVFGSRKTRGGVDILIPHLFPIETLLKNENYKFYSGFHRTQ